MNLLPKLLSILHQARIDTLHLNHEDTLVLLESVKHISEDQFLIEKVINLILISEGKGLKIRNLSKRQTQIFTHIGLGFSSREIGNLLQISEATVSTHRKQIIKKLGLARAGKLQHFATQYVQDRLYH
ncbi:MAG: response regulator transcription factor [Flavobacteriaceae bacterium]|nr:response regulator transcription factor [Flavobacteriaceae bacterium]